MISTIIITKTKFIYYNDIKKLEIEKMSGLKVEEIKLNYNYTINYIFDNSIIDFKPPTISSSIDGSQHFKEVRQLFNLGILILKSGSIIFIILLIGGIRNKWVDFKFLKYSSIIILCIPVFALLLLKIEFTAVFTIFHKMLFNNDKWLLDPVTDPIINIMPEAYFAHCAIGIVMISSVIAIAILLIYSVNKKQLLKIKI